MTTRRKFLASSAAIAAAALASRVRPARADNAPGDHRYRDQDRPDHAL